MELNKKFKKLTDQEMKQVQGGLYKEPLKIHKDDDIYAQKTPGTLTDFQ